LEINSDLPKLGDRIIFDRYEFVIEAVDNKRINKIKVLIREEDTVDNKHKE
jgi:Mg2+/Co2+ transporter CorC